MPASRFLSTLVVFTLMTCASPLLVPARSAMAGEFSVTDEKADMEISEVSRIYLDGKLARSRQQLSDFGRMFDSIADKLLVGACLMVLAGYARLPYASLWPAIIILCREILVSGMREYLAERKASLPVTRLAKWKTGFQMTAIGFLLAGDGTGLLLQMPWLHVAMTGACLLWIAAVLTLITGWDYLTTGLRYVEL